MCFEQYIYLKHQPIAKLEQKELYAIHSDHLGTPRLATNDDKQTVWKANYSPFGKATLETNNITLNLRLPGQYEDQETGTHYNYLRDYNPETGRYITSDPIGLKGGVNTYAYVGGNPLGLTDRLGLVVEPEADTSPLSDPIPFPAYLFGTRVHSLFADYVRDLNDTNGVTDGDGDIINGVTENFGGGDGRFFTWRGSAFPDAYYSFENENNSGQGQYELWELKPYSHTKGINPRNYRLAGAQLQRYIDDAHRGGPWSQGSCSRLFPLESVRIGYVKHWGQWYKITVHQDPEGANTGLLFYTQNKVDDDEVAEGESLLDRLERFLRDLLGTDVTPNNGTLPPLPPLRPIRPIIPPPVIIPTPVGPILIP